MYVHVHVHKVEAVFKYYFFYFVCVCFWLGIYIFMVLSFLLFLFFFWCALNVNFHVLHNYVLHNNPHQPGALEHCTTLLNQAGRMYTSLVMGRYCIVSTFIVHGRVQEMTKYSLTPIHVLRDAEGRKKQARSYKLHSKATQHTQGKMSCLGWDSNPMCINVHVYVFTHTPSCSCTYSTHMTESTMAEPDNLESVSLSWSSSSSIQLRPLCHIARLPDRLITDADYVLQCSSVLVQFCCLSLSLFSSLV